MPMDQNLIVSSNGFRKGVANCHKTPTENPIENPSIAME